MLNPNIVVVDHQGPLVTLKLGNVEIKMEYETAIQLSTWLRVHGKAAKRAAGDDSRKWQVIGNLEAVEAGDRPWKQ
jgi:hypothetical protein